MCNKCEIYSLSKWQRVKIYFSSKILGKKIWKYMRYHIMPRISVGCRRCDNIPKDIIESIIRYKNIDLNYNNCLKLLKLESDNLEGLVITNGSTSDIQATCCAIVNILIAFYLIAEDRE